MGRCFDRPEGRSFFGCAINTNMRIYEIINEGEVVQFPGGGSVEPPAQPRQISMLQAFGSDQMNILKDVLPNRGFYEKPSYFEDIGRNPKHVLSEFELHKLQKAFGQAGIDLPVFTGSEIYHTPKPKYPMADADLPDAKTFILEFPDGERFLVDRTGAHTYIRMWMAIQ